MRRNGASVKVTWGTDACVSPGVLVMSTKWPAGNRELAGATGATGHGYKAIHAIAVLQRYVTVAVFVTAQGGRKKERRCSYSWLGEECYTVVSWQLCQSICHEVSLN